MKQLSTHIILCLIFLPSCISYDRSQAIKYYPVKASYKHMTYLNHLNALNRPNKTQKLKVATYNLGLLEMKLLGIVIAGVPAYSLRSKLLKTVMTRFISRNKPDIMSFQEIWHKPDFFTLSRVARKLGYTPLFTNYHKVAPYGLQVIVKNSLYDPKSAIQSRITPFTYRRWINLTGSKKKEIHEPVLSITEQAGATIRGYSVSTLKLRGVNKNLLIFNTHLTCCSTFLEGYSDIRLKQVEVLSDAIKQESKAADYVLVMGDFNSSPEIKNIPKGELALWKDENTEGYKYFLRLVLEHTNLLDTFKVSNPHAFGFTINQESNTLTAITESSRYEPKQRLDFIFFGNTYNASNWFYIKQSKLIFNTPIQTSSQSPVFFSDHFGVMSEIEVGKSHFKAR